MVKVIKVEDEGLKFEDGSYLTSHHDHDCCEDHYLCFKDLSLQDFEGLEFDLDRPNQVFEKVEGYGIRLLPTNGQPVSVPGYGYNNGYYSDHLDLIIQRKDSSTTFDITKCQVVEG